MLGKGKPAASKPTKLTHVGARRAETYSVVLIAVSPVPGSEPDTHSGCSLHIY